MTLIDTATAAAAAGVRPATIRWWVHAGHLAVAARTPRGNQYRLDDVMRAVDRTTRVQHHA